MLSWTVILSIIMLIVLGLITIPTLTYMMTKCFFDAKNKSTLDFHNYLISQKENENG